MTHTWRMAGALLETCIERAFASGLSRIELEVLTGWASPWPRKLSKPPSDQCRPSLQPLPEAFPGHCAARGRRYPSGCGDQSNCRQPRQPPRARPPHFPGEAMFDSESLRQQAEATDGMVQVGAWELRSLLDTYNRYRDALELIAADQVHGLTWCAVALVQRSHARRALDRQPSSGATAPATAPGSCPGQKMPLPSRHPHCGTGGAITTYGLQKSPRYSQRGKPRNLPVSGLYFEWWFLRDSNPGPSD